MSVLVYIENEEGILKKSAFKADFLVLRIVQFTIPFTVSEINDYSQNKPAAR